MPYVYLNRLDVSTSLMSKRTRVLIHVVCIFSSLHFHLISKYVFVTQNIKSLKCFLEHLPQAFILPQQVTEARFHMPLLTTVEGDARTEMAVCHYSCIQMNR